MIVLQYNTESKARDNMKDKKAETLEQFMTVVYENGYSSDMVKEECEEIIKTCTVEGNSMETVANIYTAMAGYTMVPGMPINERKQMVKGMLLTQLLYLEFGRNQELSEEQLFASTIRIAERTNMLPKTEQQAFQIGVSAEVRLLYYNKTK